MILKLTTLYQGQVMFADAEDKPERALSLPRKAWADLGHPVTLTVSLFAGGDFVEKPEVKGSDPLEALKYVKLAKDSGGYL